MLPRPISPRSSYLPAIVRSGMTPPMSAVLRSTGAHPNVSTAEGWANVCLAEIPPAASTLRCGMAEESAGQTPPERVTTRGSSIGCPLDVPADLVPALTILWHPRLEHVGERAILGDIALRDAISLSRMEPCFGPPGASSGTPL